MQFLRLRVVIDFSFFHNKLLYASLWRLFTDLPVHQAGTVLAVNITAPLVFALTVFGPFDRLSDVTPTAAHGMTVFGAGRRGVAYSETKKKKKL